MRKEIEKLIDEVVDTFWNGDKSFKKLLKETAAHESHYGELSENVMQVDPVQVTEMMKVKYEPQLSVMGVRPGKNGRYDVNDPRTSIILGAMRYLTQPGWKKPGETQGERIRQWKKFYNTEEGKGTPEAFKNSLNKFNMLDDGKETLRDSLRAISNGLKKELNSVR